MARRRPASCPPSAASSPTDAERDAFEAPILETYEREGSPYFATARLWDDGVIDPLDTRRVLAMGIEAALHAPIPDDAVRRVPDVASRRCAAVSRLSIAPVKGSHLEHPAEIELTEQGVRGTAGST